MLDYAHMASSSVRLLKPIIPSAFLAFGAGASYDYQSRETSGYHGESSLDYSSRAVRAPLTTPMHPLADPSDEVMASNLAQNDDIVDFTDEVWITTALRSQEWQNSIEQLLYVEAFEDGWDGVRSKRADVDAIADAFFLLTLLESERSNLLAPMIGLDADGIVVFTWESEDLVGSLSVFGDDTFAYYLERNDEVISSGEASLSEGISPTLATALLV